MVLMRQQARYCMSEQTFFRSILNTYRCTPTVPFGLRTETPTAKRRGDSGGAGIGSTSEATSGIGSSTYYEPRRRETPEPEFGAPMLQSTPA